jgi:hypothetical protein
VGSNLVQIPTRDSIPLDKSSYLSSSCMGSTLVQIPSGWSVRSTTGQILLFILQMCGVLVSRFLQGGDHWTNHPLCLQLCEVPSYPDSYRVYVLCPWKMDRSSCKSSRCQPTRVQIPTRAVHHHPINYLLGFKNTKLFIFIILPTYSL